MVLSCMFLAGNLFLVTPNGSLVNLNQVSSIIQHDRKNQADKFSQLGAEFFMSGGGPRSSFNDSSVQNIQKELKDCVARAEGEILDELNNQ